MDDNTRPIVNPGFSRINRKDWKRRFELKDIDERKQKRGNIIEALRDSDNSLELARCKLKLNECENYKQMLWDIQSILNENLKDNSKVREIEKVLAG